MSVGDADRALVLLGHLADDGQAEPAALLAPGANPAVEAVKDERQVALVDAMAVVPDPEALTAHLHLHRASRRRVAGRVVQEVVDRAGQPLRRALHDDGLE